MDGIVPSKQFQLFECTKDQRWLIVPLYKQKKVHEHAATEWVYLEWNQSISTTQLMDWVHVPVLVTNFFTNDEDAHRVSMLSFSLDWMDHLDWH